MAAGSCCSRVLAVFRRCLILEVAASNELELLFGCLLICFREWYSSGINSVWVDEFLVRMSWIRFRTFSSDSSADCCSLSVSLFIFFFCLVCDLQTHGIESH